MAFDLGRSEGLPTQYSANQTPVTVDVLDAGFITAFLIIFVCLLIFIPSTNFKVSSSIFIRISLSLLIGLLIMLGNFGQEWEVGHIITKTPYRAGLDHEINASIGIKIGLRSVNVTLKSTTLPKETINYNERFSWGWDQGRFGFGPYAGRIQREFREAQRKGLPIPILWVVDYFVIDGEGFRHGRFYRTAGWYCHIAMWTAFPCWLLANILFRSVIQYGAYFLGIAGGLLLTANLVWVVVRNPNPLIIPFEDAIITTRFGVSYWLTFCTGFLCLTISGVIIFVNYYYDKELYIFFGLDPLNDYEEAYLTNEEESLLRNKNKKIGDAMQMLNLPSTSEDSEGRPQTYRPYYFKRSIYKPSHKPKKVIDFEDDAIYENFQSRNEDVQYDNLA